MSTGNVRKWLIAAPIIGFWAVGCGSANTTFNPIGGGGNGGTAPGAGGEPGGGGSSAGMDAGGTAGAAPTGTSGAGGSSASGGAGGSNSTAGSGGSAGSTGSPDPTIDYEPVGIGDPWFFSSASELAAFEVEFTGATGSAVWNEAGEVHLPLAFNAAGEQALIHFTAPWNAVANSHDPIDLTHRRLEARVRLASGATATGGVQGYSQSSPAWSWVNGNWNSFADLGSWKDVEFDFDTATAPGGVLRFGLQVYATGAGSAELIIDDLRLEPKPAPPEPDAGVPEGDAGGGDPPLVDAGTGSPDAGSDAG